MLTEGSIINIIWYGGEPTLEIETIRYLTSEIKKTGKQFSAYMITNGYHIDNIIEYIEELSISGIQITLDGIEDTHDKTRYLLNGGKTFKKIISNIEMLLARCNISINIRMNISKDNSDQFALLYEFLRERFHNKVNLYPAFVVDYNNSCKSGSCYETNYEKGIFLKELFFKYDLYCKSLYPSRMSKGCMSQQLYSYVIGPSGELYKCWHHIGNKNKIIGNIFEKHTIKNYSLLADMLIRNDSIFDEKCKKCILFPSCYGGCVDNKNKKIDYCNPTKSMLNDFIDIRYLYKQAKVIE